MKKYDKYINLSAICLICILLLRICILSYYDYRLTKLKTAIKSEIYSIEKKKYQKTEFKEIALSELLGLEKMVKEIAINGKAEFPNIKGKKKAKKAFVDICADTLKIVDRTKKMAERINTENSDPPDLIDNISFELEEISRRLFVILILLDDINSEPELFKDRTLKRC